MMFLHRLDIASVRQSLAVFKMLVFLQYSTFWLDQNIYGHWWMGRIDA